MTRLTILFLGLANNSFGQIKTGLYKEVSDTIFIGKAWILEYSNITLSDNKTFSYNHRTSEGCLLWYDIKGTWFTKSNKLYLVDSVLSQNDLYDKIVLVRTTVFQIQKTTLKNPTSFFEDKGYLPIQNITGNFICKQD
jgi:hypothetical protein